MSEPKAMGGVLTRILEGRAPRPIRSAAARGALALSRTALVRLYVALREDEDEEIRTDAENSLACLEHDAVLEVLRDEDCAPEVIRDGLAKLGKFWGTR